MKTTVAALRDERNQKIAAMEQIINAEDFGDESQATYDAMQGEVDKINARIERMEKLEATKADLSTPDPAVAEAAVKTLASMPEAKQKFESGDEMVAAVIQARVGNKVDQRLSWQNFPKAEQSMGVGAKGGFMVPNYLASEFLAVDPAATPLLSMVRRAPATGSHPDAQLTMSALDQTTNQHGGVTVSRIGEGHTKPETDADLEQLTWTPSEIAAHIPFTDQLDDNWSGLQPFLAERLRAALNAALENEIVRGAGGMQFTGIIGHAGTIGVNRVGGANAFVLADAFNMESRFLEREGSAVWLVNPVLKGQVMGLVNAGGFAAWHPNVVPGEPSTLNGKPIYWYEFASAIAANGSVMLLRPDYYVIKDGSGPFIDVGWSGTDFITNRRRIKIWQRNDGQPWLTQPFRLANGVDTVSPFVTLDVP